MFEPTALATTRAAVDMAKDKGAIIAIDANIRPLRWIRKIIVAKQLRASLKTQIF